jgi:PhnB protein
MSTSVSSPVVQVYLNFAGRCEEAIEFYKTALDAKVEMILRFKDAPADSQCPGADGDKVMHSGFRIGNTLVMASDCAGGDKPKFEGFSLAISVTSEADADRLFAALSEGGKVEMPLDKTFWSPRFGVVSDKFGVSWMIDTTAPA